MQQDNRLIRVQQPLRQGVPQQHKKELPLRVKAIRVQLKIQELQQELHKEEKIIHHLQTIVLIIEAHQQRLRVAKILIIEAHQRLLQIVKTLIIEVHQRLLQIVETLIIGEVLLKAVQIRLKIQELQQEQR